MTAVGPPDCPTSRWPRPEPLPPPADLTRLAPVRRPDGRREKVDEEVAHQEEGTGLCRHRGPFGSCLVPIRIGGVA